MKALFFLFILSIIISGCYTYNIPSGATVPLITEAGETKATFNANFNELGGTVTVGLNEHAVFSASGQAILWNRQYDQHYDSVIYHKTPNNFEVAFGYHGHRDKYANLLMFGIGTGNNTYTNSTGDMGYGYYQTDYIQYFLQYTAGLKYEKWRRGNLKQKEQGISMRYAYHEYDVRGIESRDKWEEVWNEAGYWDYVYYTENFEISERGSFNSFSFYYFYRSGNERIQFEISPGYTFYSNKPKYSRDLISSKLHFNVGVVFRLNQLF